MITVLCTVRIKGNVLLRIGKRGEISKSGKKKSMSG